MIQKRFAAPTLLALTAIFSAPIGKAFAAPIMFATFSEPSASQGFTYQNHISSGAVVTSTAVDFEFTVPTGLGTSDHAATLTIATPGSGNSSLFSATVVGAFLDQPITNVTTLSIIENGTGKNLLTMQFTGDIVGQIGSPNAFLSGADSTGQVVTFTSDFLIFTAPGNSFNLGLATATSFQQGPGGFLSTMQANVDGMFTANAAPSGGGVPEPGTLAVLGVALATLTSRRRSKS